MNIGKDAMYYIERDYLRAISGVFRKQPFMCFRRNIIATFIEFLR